MIKLAAKNTSKSRVEPLVTALEKETSAKNNHAQSFSELRFKLSNDLQSTLDLHETLRTFYETVSSLVQCTGLAYTNENIDEPKIEFGDSEPHSANYSLSSKNENSGDLKLSRKHPFAEAELAVIEMMIGVLFYPLRNALKYRAALKNALIDGLTGINNRHALELASARELKLAQRHKKALSMLVIDIDHFKVVNDTHGHYTGDQALKHVADVIGDTLRESDQVFRYGGEEFVALLTETQASEAKRTAERIRYAIETNPSSTESGDKIELSASVGVAALTEDDDFSSLFARADDALYSAKHGGRNQVVCATQAKEIKKIA